MTDILSAIDLALIDSDPQLQAELIEYAAAQSAVEEFESLEELVTDPTGFGLTTATPLQRAICRVLDGTPLGDLEDHPDVVEALGSGSAPKDLPLEVLVIAAVRCAKSLVAAALGIWCSRNVDVSPATSEGDFPRFSIASLELDNAKQVLAHLMGAVRKPRVAAMLVDVRTDLDDAARTIRDSGSKTIGSVYIRNKSGTPVEIRVIAGKRAGGSAVSRWSAGMVLDEAPRMVGSSDGVINYDDMRKAVLSRLLPGAILFSIGSPHAPRGPVYEVVRKEWGYPTVDRIVFKARGPQMNPLWWTKDRCERLKRLDPTAYKTDVLAEFADEEDQLFAQETLNAICTEEARAPWEPGHGYHAAIDPATRNHAWTLVVFTKDHDGVVRQVVASQWQGSPVAPLRPKKVFKEVSEILSEYKVTEIYTDQWSADSLADIADDVGLTLVSEAWTGIQTAKAFLDLAKRATEHMVKFTDDPLVRKDLLAVKSKPTQAGVQIVLPQTPDGRHADYAAAIAKCVWSWIEDPEEVPPVPGTLEHDKWLEEKLEQEEAEDDKEQPWWAK